MTATTLLLATFLATATTQQEQPAATAQQPPSPTTIINQGINKEEIKEALRELQEEQAQNKQPEQQHREETQPPAWLNTYIAATTLIVAIFTAVIVGCGIYLIKYTWQQKKEIDATAQKVQKTEEKLLHSIDAKSAQEHPDKAKEITAAAQRGEYETLIDRAIAGAITLQTDEQYELAKEKWLAIANITEEQDKETAARAYSSAAYLIQTYGDKYKNEDKDTISEVISLYDKALSIKSDNTAILNNIGNAKADLGQFQGAIEDFDKALSIKPDYAEALYNRGNAKRRLGQHLEAIEDYDKALSIEPDDAETLNNRGTAKAHLGQWQNAMEDFNKALKINPDYANALNNRGRAKLILGDSQGAKEDAERALQIDPDQEKAKELLAMIKEKDGK